MANPLISKTVVSVLLAIGILIPIFQGVLYWVRALLLSMADVSGAEIVGRLVLAGGVIWLVDLVFLVLVLAARSLCEDDLSSSE